MTKKGSLLHPILEYFQRRKTVSQANEAYLRVCRAKKKARTLKDVEALDHTLDALRQATKEKDIKAVSTQLKALEDRVAAEPGLALKSHFRETVEWVAMAVLLAMFVRTFFFEAFQIPTGSMEPTLLVGDHLFVNKITYGVRVPFTDYWPWRDNLPEQGDIVVFRYPGDGKTDYIKRIIGLPGDTVDLREKKLYINGQPVDEPWAFSIPRGKKMSYRERMIVENYPGTSNRPMSKVPEGHYFVMGDNRNNSYDSRFWGYVPQENLVGKAWRIYWSSIGCLPFSEHDCEFHFDRIGSSIQSLNRSRE